MTSKVNGTMQISTLCRSETPENIETKIGHNDYVMGPFNPANFRRRRSNGVRSAYSWNITLNCVIPFFPFFSCRRLQQKLVDGFSRSIPQTTRLHPRMCLLRASMRKKLFRVPKPHKIPKKWAWLGISSQTEEKLNFQYLRNNKIKSDQYEIWQDT